MKAFQKASGIRVDGIVGSNTKAQFKLKGYKEGGGVYDTAPIMAHGTMIQPEYMYSAPKVESMMDSVPALLENLANGSTGGNVNIENFNSSSGNPMTIYRTLKQVGALASTAGNKRR